MVRRLVQGLSPLRGSPPEARWIRRSEEDEELAAATQKDGQAEQALGGRRARNQQQRLDAFAGLARLPRQLGRDGSKALPPQDGQGVAFYDAKLLLECLASAARAGRPRSGCLLKTPI